METGKMRWLTWMLGLCLLLTGAAALGHRIQRLGEICQALLLRGRADAAQEGDGSVDEAALALKGQWFAKSDAFDAQIRARFGATIDAALAGQLQDWASTPQGWLARLPLWPVQHCRCMRCEPCRPYQAPWP